MAPIILFLISAPLFSLFSKRPGRLKGPIRYLQATSISCRTVQVLSRVDYEKSFITLIKDLIIE